MEQRRSNQQPTEPVTVTAPITPNLVKPSNIAAVIPPTALDHCITCYWKAVLGWGSMGRPYADWRAHRVRWAERLFVLLDLIQNISHLSKVLLALVGTSAAGAALPSLVVALTTRVVALLSRLLQWTAPFQVQRSRGQLVVATDVVCLLLLLSLHLTPLGLQGGLKACIPTHIPARISGIISWYMLIRVTMQQLPFVWLVADAILWLLMLMIVTHSTSPAWFWGDGQAWLSLPGWLTLLLAAAVGIGVAAWIESLHLASFLRRNPHIRHSRQSPDTRQSAGTSPSPVRRDHVVTGTNHSEPLAGKDPVEMPVSVSTEQTSYIASNPHPACGHPVSTGTEHPKSTGAKPGPACKDLVPACTDLAMTGPAPLDPTACKTSPNYAGHTHHASGKVPPVYSGACEKPEEVGRNAGSSSTAGKGMHNLSDLKWCVTGDKGDSRLSHTYSTAGAERDGAVHKGSCAGDHDENIVHKNSGTRNDNASTVHRGSGAGENNENTVRKGSDTGDNCENTVPHDSGTGSKSKGQPALASSAAAGAYSNLVQGKPLNPPSRSSVLYRSRLQHRIASVKVHTDTLDVDTLRALVQPCLDAALLAQGLPRAVTMPVWFRGCWRVLVQLMGMAEANAAGSFLYNNSAADAGAAGAGFQNHGAALQAAQAGAGGSAADNSTDHATGAALSSQSGIPALGADFRSAEPFPDWSTQLATCLQQALPPCASVSQVLFTDSPARLPAAVVPQPLAMIAPPSQCTNLAALHADAQWLLHNLVLRLPAEALQQHPSTKAIRVVVSLPHTTVPLYEQRWSRSALQELPRDEDSGVTLPLSGLAAAGAEDVSTVGKPPLLLVTVLREGEDLTCSLQVPTQHTATSAHAPAAEHLLASASVLLLPDAAACADLSALFQRMVQECGGDFRAAYSHYMYPFMMDLSQVLCPVAAMNAFGLQVCASMAADMLQYMYGQQLTHCNELVLQQLQQKGLMDAVRAEMEHHYITGFVRDTSTAQLTGMAAAMDMAAHSRQGMPAGQHGEQDGPVGQHGGQNMPAGQHSRQGMPAGQHGEQDAPVGQHGEQDMPAEQHGSHNGAVPGWGIGCSGMKQQGGYSTAAEVWPRIGYFSDADVGVDVTIASSSCTCAKAGLQQRKAAQQGQCVGDGSEQHHGQELPAVDGSCDTGKDRRAGDHDCDGSDPINMIYHKDEATSPLAMPLSWLQAVLGVLLGWEHCGAAPPVVAAVTRLHQDQLPQHRWSQVAYCVFDLFQNAVIMYLAMHLMYHTLLVSHLALGLCLVQRCIALLCGSTQLVVPRHLLQFRAKFIVAVDFMVLCTLPAFLLCPRGFWHALLETMRAQINVHNFRATRCAWYLMVRTCLLQLPTPWQLVDASAWLVIVSLTSHGIRVGSGRTVASCGGWWVKALELLPFAVTGVGIAVCWQATRLARCFKRRTHQQ